MLTIQRLAIVGVLLSACHLPVPPVATTPSSNAQVPVDVLLQVDGCTVYRFIDSTPHYFARCDARGSGPPSVTTMTPTRCGKGCTVDETVTTTTPI